MWKDSGDVKDLENLGFLADIETEKWLGTVETLDLLSLVRRRGEKERGPEEISSAEAKMGLFSGEGVEDL